MNDDRRQALLQEYGEVSNNFRTLTDIRFRMLSLLPIATGAVAATAAIKGDLTSIGSLPFSLFGLAATIGLATYNARNDQLYNELVGRAASIERSLGLPDGSFANRPKDWLTIRWNGIHWKVNHGMAIATIYTASVALWLSLIFSSILELGRRLYAYYIDFPHFSVPDPSVWINGIAVLLAIRITYVGYNWIKVHVNDREDELRGLAARAYKTALCFDDVRMAFYDHNFIEQCARLSSDTTKNEKTLARACFYARIDPDSLGYYVLVGSKEQSAAHVVALLTDFPPGWVLDCGENRKGSIR